MSPMNNRILRPLAVPGVLDFAPGAAAAYSLRNLSLSYADPVVTVRRSTDNAEADFTASEVSDGTLAGWAGADGFVKQWWDQSGNARHATQATAAAQPQIVDSGVLVTEGGKAAVRFDGTNDTLATANIQTSPSESAFLVCQADAWHEPVASALYRGAAAHGYARSETSGVAFCTIVRGSSPATDWQPGDILAFGSGYQATSNPRAIGPIPDGSDQRVVSTILGTVNGTIHMNGVLRSTRVSTAGSVASINLPVTIGSSVLAFEYWLGTISELIIYPTDQTALRPRIEGNINRHFGVF